MNSTSIISLEKFSRAIPLSLFVFCGISIILNATLVVALLFSKTDQENNCFLFIGGLCGSTILWNLTIFLREITTTINLAAYTHGVCKTFMLVSFTGMQMEFWNLVGLVVDQLVMVAYPFTYIGPRGRSLDANGTTGWIKS
jgi:hypothetical protein